MVLCDDAIRIGIETRKKLRALKAKFTTATNDERKAWFFDPFVPDE
jgi:hypothetical protein